MSQAEIPNLNLSVIMHFSLIKITSKTIRPKIYSGMITMETLFKGSLFSACDVMAWVRNVIHWTSTKEK